ncbi:MAG TPA: isoprenylcysteine carboxylmethyltransferase family protein [Thermoanaerobaculia bacterium]|jgi:protein-S-isoprenylcysteine O-methyltransferase Ste14|nr:isoprenylcysteine carboxylmethyltransferase family protein [Thermoanaerobaculia bacterium]
MSEAILSGQAARTKTRLAVSRLFGLGVLSLLVGGSTYWRASGNHLFASVLFFLGIMLACLGFFGRVWCLSFIKGRKKRVLVKEGPYSLCRHPLYLFSLIGGVGVGLCTQTLTIPLIFLAAFALYYPIVIRKEEEFLGNNFEGYEAYKRESNAIFPRWSTFAEGETVTMCARSFRQELTEAAGSVAFIGLIGLVQGLQRAAILPTFFLLP